MRELPTQKLKAVSGGTLLLPGEGLLPRLPIYKLPPTLPGPVPLIPAPTPVMWGMAPGSDTAGT